MNPASQAPCLIAAAKSATDDEQARERAAKLERAGAEIIWLPSAGGWVDLNALLEELGSRQIMSVLVEGGARLAGTLLKQNLIDKFLLFYAPKIIGDQHALSAFSGLEIDDMAEARPVSIESVQQLGDDILVTAYPCSRD